MPLSKVAADQMEHFHPKHTKTTAAPHIAALSGYQFDGYCSGNAPMGSTQMEEMGSTTGSPSVGNTLSGESIGGYM